MVIPQLQDNRTTGKEETCILTRGVRRDQSSEAYEQWCLRLGLTDQAKAIITQIRTSPPARHVQRVASNVSGTYPNRKKGYREEIRQIALYLQAEQVTLTQKHIGRYLAQPAILRDPHVRALLREVRREVEGNLTGTLE